MPLILAGNDEVVLRRGAIRRANEKDDRVNLEKWARLYDITLTNQDNDTLTRQLLSRADVILVPIALAQAAVESDRARRDLPSRGMRFSDGGHGVMMRVYGH